MISDESFAICSACDESVVVEVIFSLVSLAGGDAAVVDAEGSASHGNVVGVEAVGAFSVEGVEGGWQSDGAISHDDAFVVAEYNRSFGVKSIEERTAAVSGAVGEVEVRSPTLQAFCDGAEDAWCVGVHGAGECGVLVRAVVEDEEALADGVFAGSIPTGTQNDGAGEECCE